MTSGFDIIGSLHSGQVKLNFWIHCETHSSWKTWVSLHLSLITHSSCTNSNKHILHSFTSTYCLAAVLFRSVSKIVLSEIPSTSVGTLRCCLGDITIISILIELSTLSIYLSEKVSLIGSLSAPAAGFLIWYWCLICFIAFCTMTSVSSFWLIGCL